MCIPVTALEKKSSAKMNVQGYSDGQVFVGDLANSAQMCHES